MGDNSENDENGGGGRRPPHCDDDRRSTAGAPNPPSPSPPPSSARLDRHRHDDDHHDGARRGGRPAPPPRGANENNDSNVDDAALSSTTTSSGPSFVDVVSNGWRTLTASWQWGNVFGGGQQQPASSNDAASPARPPSPPPPSAPASPARAAAPPLLPSPPRVAPPLAASSPPPPAPTALASSPEPAPLEPNSNRIDVEDADGISIVVPAKGRLDADAEKASGRKRSGGPAVHVPSSSSTTTATTTTRGDLLLLVTTTTTTTTTNSPSADDAAAAAAANCSSSSSAGTPPPPVDYDADPGEPPPPLAPGPPAPAPARDDADVDVEVDRDDPARPLPPGSPAPAPDDAVNADVDPEVPPPPPPSLPSPDDEDDEAMQAAFAEWAAKEARRIIDEYSPSTSDDDESEDMDIDDDEVSATSTLPPLDRTRDDEFLRLMLKELHSSMSMMKPPQCGSDTLAMKQAFGDVVNERFHPDWQEELLSAPDPQVRINQLQQLMLDMIRKLEVKFKSSWEPTDKLQWLLAELQHRLSQRGANPSNSMDDFAINLHRHPPEQVDNFSTSTTSSSIAWSGISNRDDDLSDDDDDDDSFSLDTIHAPSKDPAATAAVAAPAAAHAAVLAVAAAAAPDDGSAPNAGANALPAAAHGQKDHPSDEEDANAASFVPVVAEGSRSSKDRQAATSSGLRDAKLPSRQMPISSAPVPKEDAALSSSLGTHEERRRDDAASDNKEGEEKVERSCAKAERGVVDASLLMIPPASRANADANAKDRTCAASATGIRLPAPRQGVATTTATTKARNLRVERLRMDAKDRPSSTAASPSLLLTAVASGKRPLALPSSPRDVNEPTQKVMKMKKDGSDGTTSKSRSLKSSSPGIGARTNAAPTASIGAATTSSSSRPTGTRTTTTNNNNNENDPPNAVESSRLANATLLARAATKPKIGGQQQERSLHHEALRELVPHRNATNPSSGIVHIDNGGRNRGKLGNALRSNEAAAKVPSHTKLRSPQVAAATQDRVAVDVQLVDRPSVAKDDITSFRDASATGTRPPARRDGTISLTFVPHHVTGNERSRAGQPAADYDAAVATVNLEDEASGSVTNTIPRVVCDTLLAQLLEALDDTQAGLYLGVAFQDWPEAAKLLELFILQMYWILNKTMDRCMSLSSHDLPQQVKEIDRQMVLELMDLFDPTSEVLKKAVARLRRQYGPRRHPFTNGAIDGIYRDRYDFVLTHPPNLLDKKLVKSCIGCDSSLVGSRRAAADYMGEVVTYFVPSHNETEVSGVEVTTGTEISDHADEKVAAVSGIAEADVKGESVAEFDKFHDDKSVMAAILLDDDSTVDDDEVADAIVLDGDGTFGSGKYAKYQTESDSENSFFDDDSLGSGIGQPSMRSAALDSCRRSSDVASVLARVEDVVKRSRNLRSRIAQQDSAVASKKRGTKRTELEMLKASAFLDKTKHPRTTSNTLNRAATRPRQGTDEDHLQASRPLVNASKEPPMLYVQVGNGTDAYGEHPHEDVAEESDVEGAPRDDDIDIVAAKSTTTRRTELERLLASQFQDETKRPRTTWNTRSRATARPRRCAIRRAGTYVLEGSDGVDSSIDEDSAFEGEDESSADGDDDIASEVGSSTEDGDSTHDDDDSTYVGGDSIV